MWSQSEEKIDREKVSAYLEKVLQNMPSDWLRLTTHRLDIYEEKLAKVQFLTEFDALFAQDVADEAALNKLPTAYDYIRLGHPLSCVLEWAIAESTQRRATDVISFASKMAPLLAVLRTDRMNDVATRIVCIGSCPLELDAELLEHVYGFRYSMELVESVDEIQDWEGSTILLTSKSAVDTAGLPSTIDLVVSLHAERGSILMVNKADERGYISDIQHFRRRETIAMTPAHCLAALHELLGHSETEELNTRLDESKEEVRKQIQDITGTKSKVAVGSSGLSVQYAIMMGAIDDAQTRHPGKQIRFIVPTNCYGGTNDQARRVAAGFEHVEIVDLSVDGDEDMVENIEQLLDAMAKEDAVPYIIAEIPTNPRVQVPDLDLLKSTLEKTRSTDDGSEAISPIFILDQTFCPNVHFLGEGEVLSTVRALSYASGSKFPSGGRCTAGYCVGNAMSAGLMDKVEKHLLFCDNEATDEQYRILAEQMPSMLERIDKAYLNTREFVEFVRETLPSAKINFVSEELAERAFKPSVFSLRLPAKGETEAEQEAHRRLLNRQLIDAMITQIPEESKFCVSYGQLKGCYWTIPATSTQGTTKEGDKDYIIRASLSPDMDLARHEEVFARFVIESGMS
jgi:cystathionine beta-lyase/cystathionine gamma-synthase